MRERIFVENADETGTQQSAIGGCDYVQGLSAVC